MKYVFLFFYKNKLHGAQPPKWLTMIDVSSIFFAIEGEFLEWYVSLNRPPSVGWYVPPISLIGAIRTTNMTRCPMFLSLGPHVRHGAKPSVAVGSDYHWHHCDLAPPAATTPSSEDHPPMVFVVAAPPSLWPLLRPHTCGSYLDYLRSTTMCMSLLNHLIC